MKYVPTMTLPDGGREAYEGSYRIIENLPEIEGADWADMAKMAARTPEKRQRKEVR